MATPANDSRSLLGSPSLRSSASATHPSRRARSDRRGLLLWWLLPASTAIQAAAIVAMFVAGSWSASVAERHFGRTDPGQVVIDEVLGMLMTLFLNPVSWLGAIVGFLLFRIADVIKPFPANRLERLPGGLGVMADDAMAAIYANLVLRVRPALGIGSSGHLVQSITQLPDHDR